MWWVFTVLLFYPCCRIENRHHQNETLRTRDITENEGRRSSKDSSSTEAVVKLRLSAWLPPPLRWVLRSSAVPFAIDFWCLPYQFPQYADRFKPSTDEARRLQKIDSRRHFGLFSSRLNAPLLARCHPKGKIPSPPKRFQEQSDPVGPLPILFPSFCLSHANVVLLMS